MRGRGVPETPRRLPFPGMDQARGLTSAEVAERTAAGRTNAVDDSSSRSLSDIVRANVVNRFNAILGVLVVVVLVAGSPGDALFGFVLVINSLVGIVQEYTSKRKLDRLALLHAPTAHVIRDGVASEVPVAAVVQGDLVELTAGDQVPADGPVMLSHSLEINQSNLTGEADSIPKAVGDAVMSGTVVTAGTGRFIAETVGADAYVHRIAAEAKQFQKTASEVRASIDRLLKWISLLLIVVVPVQIWTQFRVFGSDGWRDAVVSSAAGIVGLVPEGLVLLSTLAFLSAAVSLARQQVLVQELASVETLARVSVVCLDKTGTLTTGEIVLDSVEVLPGADRGNVNLALGAFVSVGPLNGTLSAVAGSVTPNDSWSVKDRVPFNSTRKWSGIDFGENRAWVMGAPEMLLPPGHEVFSRITPHTQKANRVVLVATVPRLTEEIDRATVQPAALIVMSEQVRDDAAETLRYFEDQGTSIKVISGDSPDTVAAIARGLGLGDGAGIDMSSHGDTPEELAEVARSGVVFGRVSPQQKRSLVKALQADGQVVAMTGDGVNDVLALKQADIGVAMDNGAPATKAVAQMVLLDGRFSHMPHVLLEGRRVIANVERVANLFLAKNAMSLLSIVLAAVFVVKYPFLPRHMTLLSSLAIGIPSYFLALGPNGRRYVPGFLRRVLTFSVPAGFAAGICAVTASWVSSHWFDASVPGACANAATAPVSSALRLCWRDGSSATIAAMVVFGWILLCLARPLARWKIALLSAVTAASAAVFVLPVLADAFRISVPWHLAALSLGVGAIGAVVVELMFRRSSHS